MSKRHFLQSSTICSLIRAISCMQPILLDSNAILHTVYPNVISIRIFFMHELLVRYIQMNFVLVWSFICTAGICETNHGKTEKEIIFNIANIVWCITLMQAGCCLQGDMGWINPPLPTLFHAAVSYTLNLEDSNIYWTELSFRNPRFVLFYF